MKKPIISAVCAIMMVLPFEAFAQNLVGIIRNARLRHDAASGGLVLHRRRKAELFAAAYPEEKEN